MNLTLKFTLLLILTAQLCKSQWAQMADMPDTTFALGSSFTIGNKGYAMKPFCNNEFWEYDPQNDTWTKKTDFPGICRFLTSGFSINGKGYIGLGRNIGNQLETDFWEYDPTTDSWTQKAQFPGAGRDHAIAFSIGSKGYLGTGFTPTGQFSGVYLNDFWEYDPGSDTWTQKANVPGPARSNAVGISLNGKGYVGLGSSPPSSPDCDDFYEYDPNLDSWTQKQNIPPDAIRDGATIFHLNNEIYVVGGSRLSGPNSPENLRTCLKYNPALNAWGYQSVFGGTASSCQVAFTFSNAAYVGGGMIIQYQNLSEWYRFTLNLTSADKSELNERIIELCPNPTSDYLNISGTLLNASPEFKLLSMDGRLILQKQISGTEEKIDLSSLPQGVFIAEITSPGTTFRKKIIKE